MNYLLMKIVPIQVIFKYQKHVSNVCIIKSCRKVEMNL